MKITIIKSIRTNNFKDELPIQKIAAMWKEASSLLRNYNGVIYGLYHDYESNYKGNYSISVAIESNEKEKSILVIPDKNYKIFRVNTSDEQGIVNTWGKIWELEEKGELPRAYTFDFEKYHPDETIEIHIAIK